MHRSSGILLPVFSLPSPGGIGTFGNAAYEFVDFLAAAGQRYWQLLPLGVTGFGDSPYQAFSAYAGNPYYIDPGMLLADGALTEEEVLRFTSDGDDTRVNYEAVYNTRYALLRCAYERAYERDRANVERFAQENAAWLVDFALFMALKAHFGMKSWLDWEDEAARLRRPDALTRYGTLLSDDISFNIYVQYLFFSQWDALRAYARSKGVLMLGDMPMYVAPDSADVWAAPELFQLDSFLRPTAVAGVPPDYFSKTGQLWGNPLYRWERMAKDNFAWWRARVKGAARLYDALRIDHFRAFASYWSVPASEQTAVNGHWEKGPGLALVEALREAVPATDFIAEDLGCLWEDVEELLEKSGLPGMKVMEFAFDSFEPSAYLPHNYKENCVCYVGTHDNAPVMAWLKEAKETELAAAEEYLGLNGDEGFAWGMIRGGMTSVARLFVAQMQDYLELGKESRINTPSTRCNNWDWRLLQGQCKKELAARIRRMCFLCGRLDADYSH